ncbi:MAG: hypothetical protein KA341_06825 [Saprospiraceae bacterium]|jgi:hypothetical protein|nr:hypothetical protein [Saprospiraceae bacterium]
MKDKPEISEDLNKALEALLNEILILHKRFEIYKDLFGTNEEYVSLLNKTSGTFFYLVQSGFMENIILSISRLSDPEEMNGYKNLSLKGLISLIDNENLINELNLQVKWYTTKTTEFLKAWRSKKVAHLDFDTAMSKAKLKNDITIQNLELAISSVRQFYNTIYNHYYGSKMVFGSNGDSTSKSLLTSLEQAKILREYIFDIRNLEEEIPDKLKVNSNKFIFKRDIKI